MMKLLKTFSCILVLIFSVNSFGLEKNCDSNTDKGQDLSKTPDVLKIILIASTSSLTISNQFEIGTDERRGCCSWHGGVCGCSNGRAVCCDQTYSPSCGCD